MVSMPQVYTARVMLQRLFPKKNAFTYGVYYLVLPLPAQNASWGALQFHAANVGLRDGSYPTPWARSTLAAYGLDTKVESLVLVTMPRVLGYVFNPVSFYLCLDEAGALIAVLCEVHNTFGEQQCYLCAHDRVTKASDALMEQKRERAGDAFFDHIEKSFVLRLLDQNWKEHLLHLDHLRQGINLRAFAQRDPLNEYKSEAFNLFNAITDLLRNMIVQNLSMVEINVDEQTFAKIEAQKREEEERHAKLTRHDPALDANGAADMDESARIPFRKRFDANDPSSWAGNVPRNADCPCVRSGKKFKYCHGKIE